MSDPTTTPEGAAMSVLKLAAGAAAVLGIHMAQADLAQLIGYAVAAFVALEGGWRVLHRMMNDHE